MKNLKAVLALLGLALTPVLFSGCASVANSTRQDVSLYSKPVGAEVIVYNNHGDVVYKGKTPCIATLDRTPPERDRANYIVLFKKEGYQSVQLPLKSRINRGGQASAWLGGVGMIVDADVGGAWTLCADGEVPELLSESPDMLRPDGLCLALQEDPNSALAKNSAVAKNPAVAAKPETSGK